MTIELKGRRVILIGGAGFIGHNLALALAREGAEVQVVDSLQVNNLLWLHSTKADLPNQHVYLAIINQRLDLLRQAGIPLIVQDARDYLALSRLITELKPEVVVHLAAVSHAGRSNKDPYSTFDHSLRTLENALDSARGRIEHFIFFSSSMVYGDFLTPEVEEDHVLNPMGIYGALKLGGEKIVIAYNQVFGLPYTIIRPSALYGPRCVSRRVGQIFIETAMDGGRLRVDGDGAERLDFTYIDDIIEANVAALNKGRAGEVYNVGGGHRETLDHLFPLFEKICQRSVRIRWVEEQKGDVLHVFAKIDKARKDLAFEPRMTLEEGLRREWEWIRTLYAGRPRRPLPKG